MINLSKGWWARRRTGAALTFRKLSVQSARVKKNISGRPEGQRRSDRVTRMRGEASGRLRSVSAGQCGSARSLRVGGAHGLDQVEHALADRWIGDAVIGAHQF